MKRILQGKRKRERKRIGNPGGKEEVKKETIICR